MIIVAVGMLIGVCLIFVARELERKDFNNGICKNCGTPLRYFDVDSHGDRGYTCDKCHKTIWVSYNVDKNKRGSVK